MAKAGARDRSRGVEDDAPVAVTSGSRWRGPSRPLPAHGHRNRPILVANGNASGLDRAAVARVEGALSPYCDSVEVRLTYSLDELDAVARQAREEDRRLVVLGGDGSVHAASNLSCTLAGECGLPDLGLIPTGRANNIAHALGIPLGLQDAARAALELPSQRIDLVEASVGKRTVHVVEGLSIGIHSRLRARYASQNSADLREVARVLGRGLGDVRETRITLRLDDGEQRVTGAQLFVANLPRYGPGLRVAPHAQPNDGALDVVLLDLPRPRAAIIPALIRLRRGTHIGWRGTRTWRSRSIDLVAHDAPVIADTTVLDPGTVRLRMMPGALPIAAPRA